MTTIGYFLILIAAFAIRGLTKGRSLTELPQDLGDAFTAIVQNNPAGLKEVTARQGTVPTTLPDAAPSDTTDRLDAIGSAQGAGAAGKALAFARAQKGKPYLSGAEGPKAYDCSGLVQAAYASAGVKLPRTTVQLILVGKSVAKADLKPGDLVFPNPGHVQLYAGNGTIVEAAKPGTVVREVPMWGFMTARRVS